MDPSWLQAKEGHMGSRIEMSQRERDILKIMSPVLQGKRTQSEAARLLRLSERQVRRIQRRLEDEGDGVVVYRLRGQASNRKLDEGLREQVLEIHQDNIPNPRGVPGTPRLS
jgi:transposase